MPSLFVYPLEKPRWIPHGENCFRLPSEWNQAELQGLAQALKRTSQMICIYEGKQGFPKNYDLIHSIMRASNLPSLHIYEISASMHVDEEEIHILTERLTGIDLGLLNTIIFSEEDFPTLVIDLVSSEQIDHLGQVSQISRDFAELTQPSNTELLEKISCHITEPLDFNMLEGRDSMETSLFESLKFKIDNRLGFLGFSFEENLSPSLLKCLENDFPEVEFMEFSTLLFPDSERMAFIADEIHAPAIQYALKWLHIPYVQNASTWQLTGEFDFTLVAKELAIATDFDFSWI